MSDILQAARSYYGLADTDVRKTDIYTNEAGQPMLVFEIAFTNDEFFGIADRMKAMNQAEGQDPPDTAIIEGPTVEAMREAYNALSKAERGKYKSFARYVAECSDGLTSVIAARADNDIKRLQEQVKEAHAIADRHVVHVDAPEEPEPVSMDAVWIEDRYCTPSQTRHYSDIRYDTEDRKIKYLIQWAMLTDEQKQKAKEAKP